MSVLRTFLMRNQQCARFATRNLSRTATTCEKPTVTPPMKDVAPSTATEASGDVNVLLGGRMHVVNNLEKRFLVWSGKYKSIDEVPATVAQESVEKARNKARIKIANYMILATIIACFVVVISGKNAQKRGESVQKMNLEWHRQIKEEAMAEAAAKAEVVANAK